MKKMFLYLTLFIFVIGSCSKEELEEQPQLEDQPQKDLNDQKSGASNNAQSKGHHNADETATPDIMYAFEYCARVDLGWWGARCGPSFYFGCPSSTPCAKMSEIGVNPDDAEDIVREMADLIGVSVEEFLDNKEDYLSAEYIAENEDLNELLNDFVYE